MNATATRTAQERAIAVIAEVLKIKPDQVVPTANFIRDLGADSLDLLQIVTDMEEEFGLEISDEEMARLETVQDVFNYLAERLAVSAELA